MDIAPCRYRFPFVAHRGDSDSLALTLFLYISLFTCLKKRYWYYLLFRMHLHEFQLLSLLNGNPSQHELRESGERRTRSPLSELPSIYSCHIFHMVPCTQAMYLWFPWSPFERWIFDLLCKENSADYRTFLFRLGDTSYKFRTVKY